MTTLEVLEGYDWQEMFKGGSAPDPYTQVAPNGSLSLVEETINRDDVEEIVYHWDTSSRDESDWDGWSGKLLARLKDSRYIFLDGWCDYTGWGCQDNVKRFVARDLRSLLNWAITPDERKEIGL